MKYIIVGTDRPESRSLAVAKIVEKKYQSIGEQVEIIELSDVGLQQISNPYSDEKPEALKQAIAKINRAESLHLIVPEYNGSYPGALKFFIDHWQYPDSFESRPVSFIGLGGRWGGLRPIEHLQGVFGYRNAYVFPERIFISNIWSVLNDGEIGDQLVDELMDSQVNHFCRFVKALNSAKLSANYKEN